MEESILKSTKKVLGLDEAYLAFDQDVITHINAAFSILNQLGVGPPEGFMIADDVTVWADYEVPDNQLHLVKTYIYLKVRLLFDPPATSYLITAMTDQVKEYEWRLNVFREWELDPNDPMIEEEGPDGEVVYVSKRRRIYRPLWRQGDALGRS